MKELKKTSKWDGMGGLMLALIPLFLYLAFWSLVTWAGMHYIIKYW